MNQYKYLIFSFENHYFFLNWAPDNKQLYSVSYTQARGYITKQSAKKDLKKLNKMNPGALFRLISLVEIKPETFYISIAKA